MRAKTCFLVLLLGGCTLYFDGPEQPEPPPETCLAEPCEPPLPPEPPPPGVSPLAAFQACMTFEDFVASGMGPAWRGLASTDNLDCQSCHSTGAFGFTSTLDSIFFELLSTDETVASKYFAVVGDDVVVNVDPIAVAGSGAGAYFQHPRFTIDEPELGALNDFYARTLANCAL